MYDRKKIVRPNMSRMCLFFVVVFDTGSVAMVSNSKQVLQNEQRLVKGEVTMCVGNESKVDNNTIACSFYLRD